MVVASRGVEWLGTTTVVGVAPAGRATPASPVNIYQAPCVALHCEISSMINSDLYSNITAVD